MSQLDKKVSYGKEKTTMRTASSHRGNMIGLIALGSKQQKLRQWVTLRYFTKKSLNGDRMRTVSKDVPPDTWGYSPNIGSKL